MQSTARSQIDIARKLLSDGGVDAIRYAALHLRLCMELLTYEKLRYYSDRVPPAVTSRWQPPQAVRALLDFEPEADQGFQVDVADAPADEISDPEHANWLSLGEHRTLPARWLRKHYHKVGSLLHASFDNGSDAPDLSNERGYLGDVADELDHVLQGNVSGSAFPTLAFDCMLCGARVVRNADEMRRGKTATCFSPECGAEFRVVDGSEQEPKVALISNYPKCTDCQQPIPVPPAKVKPGVEIKCAKCGRSHVVVRNHWIYAPK